MFDIARPDGWKAQIKGNSVLRIRRTVATEQGATRLDLSGPRIQLVTEAHDAIAGITAAEVPTLTSIHDIDGGQVWLNAKNVVGPATVEPWERRGTAIRSALLIFAPKKGNTRPRQWSMSPRSSALRRDSPEPPPPEDTLPTTLRNWFNAIVRPLRS